MIYTQYGIPVEIVGGNVNLGEADWIYPNQQNQYQYNGDCYYDNKPFQGYIAELKADNGLQEIIEAIDKANDK